MSLFETRVDWTALGDALMRVERLTHEDSGLLAFGLQQSGGIFVEKGRVCWVAARGLGRRLRDLILLHSSVDPEALERVCERCRLENRPVGQTLVAEGLVRAEELERALRHHSAECLLELCRSPLPTRWASHAGPGYAPRFTFRPVDLLLDTVGACFPERRLEATSELSALAGPGRKAAAFVFDPTSDGLLPVAEVGGLGIEALRLLGRFATSLPHASLELAAAPTFTLASTETGESILVWWREGLLFAVRCEDRACLAAVTSRHLASA